MVQPNNEINILVFFAVVNFMDLLNHEF